MAKNNKSGHREQTEISGENDLFSRLRRGIDCFTSKQQKVCSYILEHYQKIAFITVEELASLCEVSPATVVRTIQSLKYGSYQEMQAELEKMLLGTNVSLWWELERSIDDGTDDFPLPWIAKDNLEAIQGCITSQIVEQYAEAVALLLKAKTIFIIGMRSSMSAAIFFHSMLNQIIPNVRIAEASENLYDELVDLGPKDLLFAISLGGPHHAIITAKAVKFASQHSIPTVLIANAPSSPAAEFADVPLYVPTANKHYSLVACMTLLESLVVSIGQKKRATAKDKLRKLEKVLVDEGITY